MLEKIKIFITSDSGNIIQFIIAILSIGITLLTYIKVGKVKKGQEKYKKLVKSDDTINVLNEVLYLLEDIYKSCNIDNVTKDRIKLLERHIVERESTINAINTALFNENKVSFTPIYVDEGYFSHIFLDKIILNAKHSIKIYCKRNNLLFENEELLAKLFNLVLYKHVHIEIVSISTQCCDVLLEEINKSLLYPNKNIMELKKEQEKNKKKYIEFKNMIKKDKKCKIDNIKYYESIEFPLFHMVVVDDILYWGLVNYNKEDEDIPYKKTITNEFSRKILKKYEIIKNKCGRAF